MYKTWKQRGWAYDEKHTGTSCVRRRMNLCQFQHKLMRCAKFKKRNTNAEVSSTALGKDSSHRVCLLSLWSVGLSFFVTLSLLSVFVMYFCSLLLCSISFLGTSIDFFFEDNKLILNCTNSLLTLHYNSNLKITKHRQTQFLSSSWVLVYIIIQAEQVAATVWELNKDRALKPETPPLFSQPVWQQGICECFALQNISLLPTIIIQKIPHWGAILNSFYIAFSYQTQTTKEEVKK